MNREDVSIERTDVRPIGIVRFKLERECVESEGLLLTIDDDCFSWRDLWGHVSWVYWSGVAKAKVWLW